MSTPALSNPIALSVQREKMARLPRKKNMMLTKKLKLAVELLVWGNPNDDQEIMTLESAAKLAGISAKSFRVASLKPNVTAYHREQMNAYRNGQRGNNLRTAVQIRDDKKLKDTVGGQRVRLQAAAMLDQDLYTNVDHAGSAAQNITVNVVSPGYVIDLRDEPKQVAAPVHQIDHLEANAPNPMILIADVQE